MRALAIIATYNEERFIDACLAHLREQGVEAFLCDNGSSDATVEIAGGWHGWRATLTADGVRLPEQAQLRHAATDGELDASSPQTLHCTVWDGE